MNITGTISRSGEIRTTQTGKQFVTFGIAVNDSYKNKTGDRVRQTTFFDCIDWRSTKIADSLKSGQVVELSGNISARAWVAQNGEPKAALNFKISNILFHGSTKATTKKEQEPVTNIAAEADDLPF
ncbi:Single-stranded DNA-binding protein ssb [compost metagenome]